MQRRCGGRTAVATLALALVVALAVAWPSSANIGGLFPTDEDGGTAIETISSNQNLFAYALTDIQGGDICIVPAAMANPGTGVLFQLPHARHGARATASWGSAAAGP